MELQATAAFLTLATANFAAIVAFYQHLLEQPPAPLIPNTYAEFQLPGLRLGIFRPKTAAAHPSTQKVGTPPAGMSLCIEVADLEAAIAHLTQIGFPPPGTIITASHGREIYAYDPDGNLLILHQSPQ